MTAADIHADWIVNGGSAATYAWNCFLGTSFGNFDQGDYAQRTYDLSSYPHYRLYFGFEADISGSWNSESLYVREGTNWLRDNSYKYDYTSNYMNEGATHCAGDAYDEGTIDRVGYSLAHTGTTSFIYITSNLDQAKDNESWAINNFWMTVATCHESCASCAISDSFDRCTSCPTNSVFYDVDSDGYGTCLCDFQSGLFAENWACVASCSAGRVKNYVTRTCDLECGDINCSTCTGEVCTACNGGYYLLNGKCTTSCPFYTTVSGSTCVDADFAASTNAIIAYEDWSDTRFTQGRIEYDGWTYSGAYYDNFYKQNSLINYDCNGQTIVLGQTSDLVSDNKPCNNGDGCEFELSFTDLPAHYGFRLKLKALKLDENNGDFQFDAGGYDLGSIDLDKNDGVSSFCGHPDYDDQYHEEDFGYKAHTSSSITLQLDAKYNGYSYYQSVGYREIQFYLYGCNELCASCSGDPTCDTCITSRVNAPSCDTPDTGYWDDGTTTEAFPSCDMQCATCTGNSYTCLTCTNANSLVSDLCHDYDKCYKYVQITAEGFNDGNSLEAIIDGVDQGSTLTSGVEVTVFDEYINKYEVTQYDTGNSQADVDNLISYLDGLPDNTWAMIGLIGNGQLGLNPQVYEQFEDFGYDVNSYIDLYDGFALVGQKNVGGDWRIQKDGYPNTRAHVETCLVDCDATCATCQGGQNKYDCQTCNSPRYLQYNEYSDINECVTTCNDGKYAQSTPSRLCVDCPVQCSLCTSSTSCSSCAYGYYFDTTTSSCVATCPNSYYAEEDGRTCDPCDSDCDTCTGPSSSECVLCSSSPTQLYFHSDNLCYSTCPDGYYGDSGTLNCEACTTGCYTCTDSSTCTECIPGYYLSGSSCLLTCPSGYYDNPDPYNSCDPCDTICNTCDYTAPLECTSCNAGYFLYNNYCYQCNDLTGFVNDPADSTNCIEICGDGLVVSTQFECDDGNTENGDGCSSTCTIEEGYTCEGGNQYQQSICKLDSGLISYSITESDSQDVFYNLKENYSYYFTIKFDSDFFLTRGDSILQYLVVELDGVEADFPMEIYYSTDDNLKFVISLEFDRSYRERTLTIYFSDPEVFSDSQGKTLQNEQVSIQINEYFYYTEEQRQYTNDWTYYLHLGLTVIFIYGLIALINNKFYKIALVLDDLQLIYMLGFLNFRQCINGFMFFDEMKAVMNFWMDYDFGFDTDKVDTALLLCLVPVVLFIIIRLHKHDFYTEKSDSATTTIDEKILHPSFKFRNLWQFMKFEKKGVKYFSFIFMLRKIFNIIVIIVLQGSLTASVFILLTVNIFYWLWIAILFPFKNISDNLRVLTSQICIFIGIGMSFGLRIDNSEDEDSRFDLNQQLINVYTASLVLHILFLFWDTWYYFYYYSSKFCLGGKTYKVKNLREQRKLLGIEPAAVQYLNNNNLQSTRKLQSNIPSIEQIDGFNNNNSYNFSDVDYGLKVSKVNVKPNLKPSVKSVKRQIKQTHNFTISTQQPSSQGSSQKKIQHFVNEQKSTDTE
ncbi:Insulin-like growth factor binding protein, N-terminal [Pseudocohnilembus persalinus]|uniref:Insulin-like growth factor binding protein, N-terminal n=1 Tax=Pseudocohnilembus persalinus TaxID=266149 RepID=A0A0V0QZL9_PSEPJ|nr:Insulin-like growth factor binding protein, N-terminal [Pseudocohnilembus persalinus]|eukprot:KRX07488.1 Insulin-like growth factor binding protein, N-terminal [Pseudocohnilembus persalinus]